MVKKCLENLLKIAKEQEVFTNAVILGKHHIVLSPILNLPCMNACPSDCPACMPVCHSSSILPRLTIHSCLTIKLAKSAVSVKKIGKNP